MPGASEKETEKDRQQLYQDPALVPLAEKAKVCGIKLG